MVDPAPTASPADKEEYPQANGRQCKANDQKDTGNSTLILEEPIPVRNLVSKDDTLRSQGGLLGAGVCAIIGTQCWIRYYLGESADNAVAHGRGEGRGDLEGCK
jgi:hypothetical protein